MVFLLFNCMFTASGKHVCAGLLFPEAKHNSNARLTPLGRVLQVPYHPGQDDSAHAGPYGPPVKEGLEVDVESVEYDEQGRVRLDKRRNVTLAAGRYPDQVMASSPQPHEL